MVAILVCAVITEFILILFLAGSLASVSHKVREIAQDTTRTRTLERQRRERLSQAQTPLFECIKPKPSLNGGITLKRRSK